MIYVDVPVFGVAEQARWENVGVFASKEEAVAWLRKVLGEHAVDDKGRICLLTVEELVKEA